MAQKKFKIEQKVNANGVQQNVYTTITCEESEIAGIIALLEGEYTVMVEHSKGGTDARVDAFDYLQRVSMRAEGHSDVSAYIFASGSGLVIKNNRDVGLLTDIFSNIHPFPSYPAVKPVATKISFSLKDGARL